jgi:glycosyltransferase involved in cell wall biosynthesis
MPRTVVHFVDSNAMGGCEQALLTLLAGSNRRLWNPILFHRESKNIVLLLERLQSHGIACYPVPAVDRRVSFATRFVSMLKEVKPDVFHAHLNWPLACRHELVLARFMRVPGTVATAHLCSDLAGVRFSELKRRIQVACIDRFIAVSDTVREWLCDDLKVAATKIRVVKNGVNVQLPKTNQHGELRRAICADPAQSIVLTTARLHDGKGIVYLIEAAKLLPEIQLVICGDGPERGRLEEAVRKAGLQNRVTFLGHREDVPDLLSACDVFVLPSLYEALGLSVLEAMAAGKPVVATAVGGLKETVRDGVNGLLVPPRDAMSLATTIRRLLTEPGLAKSLGENAKNRVARDFSVETMVDGVTGVYEELLSDQSSSCTVEPSVKHLDSQLRI